MKNLKEAPILRHAKSPGREAACSSARFDALSALPLYIGYCALNILISPYLLVNGIRKFAKSKNWTLYGVRLLGGTPPPRKGDWFVIVGTALGDARTAVRAAEAITLTRHRDVAIWLEFESVFRTMTKTEKPFPVGVAPLKNPFSVCMALLRWRPRAIVFVETTRNLHLATIARLFGIKTMLANVNISDTRAKRYKKRPFGGWRFNSVDVLAVQSGIHRERLAQLGVPRAKISITGPALIDPVADAERSVKTTKWRDLLNLNGTQSPVIVAGSTYHKEEIALLEAFGTFRVQCPHALLILAPRYPQRAGGPDSALRETETPFARRSALRGRLPQSGVVLLDTHGELDEVYSVATAAFVGGSLIPDVGGHTPVEALAWGVPITIGPHYSQQEATVAVCEEAGVLSVCRSPEDLAEEWRRCAQDERLRASICRKSEELIARRRGVFEAWYDALMS